MSETETANTSFTNQNPDDVGSIPVTAIPKGVQKPPSPKCVYIGATVGLPYLRQGAPADGFRKLRKAVIDGAGFDFLGKLADAMRPRNLRSNKVGVADRSRHKCGDAFDYDQETPRLVIVKEPIGLQMFFRTWLKCVKQDGTQGVKVSLKDIRGHTASGWFFDFTACAERLQWRRIPAWKGWSLKGSGYNKMEFWHYQLTEGLTYDEAIRFLYAGSTASATSVKDVRTPPVFKVLGLNDRGASVRNLQEKLSKMLDENKKPYLPRDEVDGVYGKITQTAIRRLQERYNLDADGLVGPKTRQLLETLK